MTPDRQYESRAIMPFEKLPASRPAVSGLRERFLKQKLDQVELALATRSDELQTLLNYGLSPAKIDQKQFELDALRDLKTNLRDGLETIAQQNAAVRWADTDADNDAEEQIGPYRSRRAYLDNLQREREKVRPLSREKLLRAKALAAKRSRKKPGQRDLWSDVDPGVSLSSEDVLREAHPSWVTIPHQVRSYMYAKETLTGVDPCVDAKRTRRQVMFAQKTAGIGYRTRHEWKPC
jgi:hypothetical protein